MASTQPTIRAADRDRERVVAALREQTAEGRLTLDEFDERMRTAYDAKTWAELRELTADLPVDLSFGQPSKPDAQPGRGPVRRGGPPMRRGRPAFAPFMLIPLVLCVLAITHGHFGAIVPLAIFTLLMVRRFAHGYQGRFHDMSG